MINKIHLVAAVISALCIATFFTSSILVELLGSHEYIATVKDLIVMPGLFILVPAIAVTGGTGFVLSKNRKGRLVNNKQRRMRFIGANGLLVLLPVAIVLDQWAASGSFDTKFYVIQSLELLAGAINLLLMGLNMRDGLKITGKLQSSTFIRAK